MDRACRMYGGRRDVYRVLVGKPEGKRPLGIHRHRWEHNIKMDLQEVRWGSWTGLIWLRIGTGGGPCKCSNELLGSLKWREFFG